MELVIDRAKKFAKVIDKTMFNHVGAGTPENDVIRASCWALQFSLAEMDAILHPKAGAAISLAVP